MQAAALLYPIILLYLSMVFQKGRSRLRKAEIVPDRLPAILLSARSLSVWPQRYLYPEPDVLLQNIRSPECLPEYVRIS